MQRLMIGVLLAAGQSRRMGRLKQLIPWPSEHDPNAKPMVAAAFDAIAAVCNRMIVVTGTQASAVVGALRPRALHEAKVVGDGEMMVSVRAGLAMALQLDDSADVLSSRRPRFCCDLCCTCLEHHATKYPSPNEARDAISR